MLTDPVFTAFIIAILTSIPAVILALAALAQPSGGKGRSRQWSVPSTASVTRDVAPPGAGCLGSGACRRNAGARRALHAAATRAAKAPLVSGLIG